MVKMPWSGRTLTGLGAAWLLCGCPANNAAPTPAQPNVWVATASAIATVDDRYLSVAVDTSRIVNGYDPTQGRLPQLARNLAPAWLRLGGTYADTVFYDLSESPRASPPAPYLRLVTAPALDRFCAFALAADMQIMFTLNAGPGPRNQDGSWDDTNARELLAYVAAHGCPVRVWEFGNEVNTFLFSHGPGAALSAQQYAADLVRVKALVDQWTPGAAVAGPASLYWPELGEFIPFMPDVMPLAGAALDVLTWHYYPQQSDSCPLVQTPATPQTLLYPPSLDEAAIWADQVTELRNQHAPNAQVWLGETGHALCGGQPGQSDRFVSGFWWLDQLGLLALHGQAVAARQALVGGQYHLVHDDGLRPVPDYYSSLLHKRLMGSRVLAVTTHQLPRTLRVYAQCTPGSTGSVTLMVLNLADQEAAVVAGDAMGTTRLVYTLTAPSLDSSTVVLNGVALEVDPGGAPPPMAGVPTTDPVVFPPHAYGFVVLPDAGAPGCR